MEWVLTISAIVVVVAGFVVGYRGHLQLMTYAFFAFIGLLVAANLDRISEFKASGSGIEAKTREVRAVIARAETTLLELQLLARTVAEVTLSLVSRTGRWDGYDDDEAERIKTSVLEVLKKVGVPESDIPSILSEWNRTVEFDYAHFILGGSTIPETKDATVMPEWTSLREGGIRSTIPTPATLRTFLTKHKFMTDRLDEYLKDYEYFLANRVHRRPEAWADRQHWGHLKDP